MKRCSASLTIRETQMKTTVTFHRTMVRMATIKKSTNNKSRKGRGGKGTLPHRWWENKQVQSLWKIGWRFLEKLKTELPHDSSPTPGHIYPGKTRIQKDTCTPVSTAAPRQGSNLHVHQPVNGYRWMDKEDVVQIYSGIILSHKSEWNNAIYSNMSGPRNCDAE